MVNDEAALEPELMVASSITNVIKLPARGVGQTGCPLFGVSVEDEQAVAALFTLYPAKTKYVVLLLT
jgi:hypothetical protein